MKKVIFLARNEFLQIYREPQFLLPYLLIPLVTISIYVFFIFLSSPNDEESVFVSRLLMVLVGVLVTSMTLALCADSFAGEKERNTLELLLCVPVSLRVIFWGKVAGILPLPICMGWLGQIILLAIAEWGSLHAVNLLQLAMVFSLTPVSAFFITSLSIYISLKAETVRSAAQVSGILVLAFLFSMQALSSWYFQSVWNALVLLILLLAVSLFIIGKSMVKFEVLLYSVK